MSRSFTRKSLAEHKGKHGNPAYVAVEGKVYDVTKSTLWRDGTHVGRHVAGHDLTVELSAAPHGREVLARNGIEEVGTLTAGPDEHLPGFVRSVLRRFPIVRRHLHPITIHFPTAYFVAAALFTLLHIIRPSWPSGDFQAIAVAMLGLGILFTPPALVTGMFAWWVNYSLEVTPFVVRKIIFAATLVLAEVAWLVLKLGGFAQDPGGKWICTGLVFWLAVNVVILGYYGGQMVFPTKSIPDRSRKTEPAG